ncbi:MAG TPA: acyl carrier protein [Mycobacteriales bacterium]|nr:acyl carrier protein [Mycobacteriales bacterium]
MSQDLVTDRLIDFIRERFLAGDPNGELTVETPLLEWGVLDSLNTAVLLTHIRDEMGITISPVHINGRNFATVASIAALITSIPVVSAS